MTVLPLLQSKLLPLCFVFFINLYLIIPFKVISFSFLFIKGLLIFKLRKCKYTNVQAIDKRLFFQNTIVSIDVSVKWHKKVSKIYSLNKPNMISLNKGFNMYIIRKDLTNFLILKNVKIYVSLWESQV